ncbi:MAG: Hsp70 family protein [Pirellulales bacterium]|nr:Hsp70 family protein [Pirellulales bacterium]
MPPQYLLGIDLGTTNSVVAYAPLVPSTESMAPRIELLPLPQFVAPGTVENRTQLPSFLYLPPPPELQSGQWTPPESLAIADPFAPHVVGEAARRRSAEAPERTVVAAKSWLTHHKVDRRAPILPWNSPSEIPKVSPVAATQAYLAHLAAAWRGVFPTAPLAEQSVILTVPASFDASARELTREAALAAGLPADLILLEEPQAAVYAWLAEQGDHWRKVLRVGDVLLVCDVGGGTTDLTLIGVTEAHGELELQRLAVGPHLLVGGDNMDLALAHFVAEKFRETGVDLDPWQAISLWHSCRAAKEELLSANGPPVHTIAVLGRGSRLIGGAKTLEVTRGELSALLVEGFFPRCAATAKPLKRRGSGFQEIGLPFEADTAITRHLAAFFQAQGTAFPRPSHVLFNGGVFKAQPLRGRLLDVLGEWFTDEATEAKRAPPQELPGQRDLDHAVARGAVLYGWSKQHGGVRIRGGTARSYYVGIETTGLAIPSAPRPLRALCVVPFGMEEGTARGVPSGEIGLIVGEPAQFRFFSSLVRKQDQPGDLLSRWNEEELQETDSLEATLPVAQENPDDYVPVTFESVITELGVFELWCVSTRDDRRWKLEFNVRENAE